MLTRSLQYQSPTCAYLSEEISLQLFINITIKSTPEVIMCAVCSEIKLDRR